MYSPGTSLPLLASLSMTANVPYFRVLKSREKEGETLVDLALSFFMSSVHKQLARGLIDRRRSSLCPPLVFCTDLSLESV